MKNRVVKLFVNIACIAFGIIFAVVGIHQLKTKDLYDSTATATVVDIEEHWESDGDGQTLVTTAYITYEVDGVKYEHVESPSSSSSMKIGDEVEILYQSGNPEKYTGTNIGTLSIVFICVGSVVALAGVFFTLRLLLMGK